MAHDVERNFASTRPPPQTLSAGAFRNLLNAFEKLRVPLVPDAARAAAERQREQLIALIEGHRPDLRWRDLLNRARVAAEHGQHEYLLLRFSPDACTDSGRAMLRQAPDWPDTLTGDPAALHRYWADNLQSGGFRLAARVLEFTREGTPAAVGLFLLWDDATAGARGSGPSGGQAATGAEAGAGPGPAAREDRMAALLLLTAGGPLVILTSYASVLAPGLLGKLNAKGVRKFVAFAVPLDLIKQRYATHFTVVAHDLHETDDLRVLDFDGQHIFQLLRFDELGAPTFHEGD